MSNEEKSFHKSSINWLKVIFGNSVTTPYKTMKL